MSKENNIEEQFIYPPGSVIQKEIYHFLLTLIQNIFLKPKNDEEHKKIEENLKLWIEAINKNPLQNGNEINLEYSINNFKNIIHFVKTQNRILAGDILEGILILIFSYAFETEKYNTFGEFIYKNDEGKYKLEDPKNYIIVDWFKKDSLLPQELNNLREILEKENKYGDTMAEDSPFYYLILEIYKLKQTDINEKNKNKIFDKYIYRRNFLSLKIKDESFSNNFIPKNIIRYFFISVFIYYQNKNSPLMKYIKEEEREIKYENQEYDEVETEQKTLAGVPFEYNLSEAELENRFANTVLSPSRIEPRISQIIMTQNKLEERGFYELAKALIFNKYIKSCSFDNSSIKSHYLDYLNLGFGLYDNNTLEELNLSFNNINKDSLEYLDKIIVHLKNLKTLNLSANDSLKKGLASFFVMLKRLYRENKTKLENLVLNKCALDNSSFYELGELLKSKYCKLKRLYLNTNNIPAHVHFLKKLKKNKILTEVYLNKNNLGNDNIDDIMRIISNTSIQTLYLYKNKIFSFNDILRIIYRTQLVLHKYESDQPVIGHSSILGNLDLSDNYCRNRNTDQLYLLENIFNKTTLYSLDISHILAGANPIRFYSQTQSQEIHEYKVKLDEIKQKLDNERESYGDTYEEINIFEINKKEVEDYIEEYKKQILEDKDFNQATLDYLTDRIEDDDLLNENAIFPLYLREKAKELIIDVVKENNNNYDDVDDGDGDGDGDTYKTFLRNKLNIKKETNNHEFNQETELKTTEDKSEINFELYSKLENYILYNMNLKRLIINYKKSIDKVKVRKLIII